MKTKPALYIIGAGGHAKVVAHAALVANLNLVGFLSDLVEDEGRDIFGLTVSLRRDKITEPANFHVAIGANTVRTQLSRQMISEGWTDTTIIHPSAIISKATRLGSGCFVGPNSVIHPDSVLGRNVIVNTAAIVEHDCRIDDGVHLSPRAVMGGHVCIGQHSWIGIGATIRDRIQIGADVMIGAGSVVVSDIEGPGTAYGVPAKLH